MPESHEHEALWTAAEVAKYLNVSRSWVYHRSESGELPCLRIGAVVRFDPNVIRAFARGERPAGAKTSSAARAATTPRPAVHASRVADQRRREERTSGRTCGTRTPTTT